MSDFKIGSIIEAAHPFIRTTYSEMDEDGSSSVTTWSPGIRFEDKGVGDVECIADGVGAQLLTVIDIHKPGKYPTRVFFTRKWRDPAGKVFGKNSLHIMAEIAFRRVASGYRHDYSLADAAHVAAREGRK